MSMAKRREAAQADGLARRQLLPSPRITVRKKIMKRVVSKRRFSQQWASHNTSRTIRETHALFVIRGLVASAQRQVTRSTIG
jgi:hypothetical protein